MIAAAPRGSKTATIFDTKIAAAKVIATNAEVLNTSALNVNGVEPTIPNNCSSVNQIKPNTAMHKAIINADKILSIPKIVPKKCHFVKFLKKSVIVR